MHGVPVILATLVITGSTTSDTQNDAQSVSNCESYSEGHHDVEDDADDADDHDDRRLITFFIPIPFFSLRSTRVADPSGLWEGCSCLVAGLFGASSESRSALGSKGLRFTFELGSFNTFRVRELWWRCVRHEASLKACGAHVAAMTGFSLHLVFCPRHARISKDFRQGSSLA